MVDPLAFLLSTLRVYLIIRGIFLEPNKIITIGGQAGIRARCEAKDVMNQRENSVSLQN